MQHAWSLTTVSICPDRIARHKASRSSSLRMGGLTLPVNPPAVSFGYKPVFLVVSGMHLVSAAIVAGMVRSLETRI